MCRRISETWRNFLGGVKDEAEGSGLPEEEDDEVDVSSNVAICGEKEFEERERIMSRRERSNLWGQSRSRRRL